MKVSYLIILLIFVKKVEKNEIMIKYNILDIQFEMQIPRYCEILEQRVCFSGLFPSRMKSDASWPKWTAKKLELKNIRIKLISIDYSFATLKS